MASFGKQKSITEYLYSKPVILVLLVISIWLGVAVYERYTVERQMSARREETNQDKLELIERQKVLKERVEYLGGDRGIEEEIRTNFDVAKEGEQVIILVGEKKGEIPPSPTEIEDTPWYKFWQ